MPSITWFCWGYKSDTPLDVEGGVLGGFLGGNRQAGTWRWELDFRLQLCVTPREGIENAKWPFGWPISTVTRSTTMSWDLNIHEHGTSTSMAHSRAWHIHEHGTSAFVRKPE